MLRVQIPPYTDAWMRGDRYGVVEKTTKRRISQTAREQWRDVHWVKLDKSGKTLRVLADDCQEIA